MAMRSEVNGIPSFWAISLTLSWLATTSGSAPYGAAGATGVAAAKLVRAAGAGVYDEWVFAGAGAGVDFFPFLALAFAIAYWMMDWVLADGAAGADT